MRDKVRDLDTLNLKTLGEDEAQSIRGGESWSYELGHAVGEAIEALAEEVGKQGTSGSYGYR